MGIKMNTPKTKVLVSVMDLVIKGYGFYLLHIWFHQFDKSNQLICGIINDVAIFRSYYYRNLLNIQEIIVAILKHLEIELNAIFNFPKNLENSGFVM